MPSAIFIKAPLRHFTFFVSCKCGRFRQLHDAWIIQTFGRLQQGSSLLYCVLCVQKKRLGQIQKVPWSHREPETVKSILAMPQIRIQLSQLSNISQNSYNNRINFHVLKVQLSFPSDVLNLHKCISWALSEFGWEEGFMFLSLHRMADFPDTTNKSWY